MVKEDRFVII